MTDGWAGFRATPKPLTGVSVEETSSVFSTPMLAAQVIGLLTTAAGLTSWLGEVASLKLGVGAKAKVALEERSIEILFTCLDFPGHIVFMSESLGELDFKLTESKSGTKVHAVIRRAVRPEEQLDWASSTSQILQRLEKIAADA
jgi:hypothetical protein